MSMTRRLAALAAALLAGALTAGCAEGVRPGRQDAGLGNPALDTPARAPEGAASCGPAPRQEAWSELVADDGRIRWRTPLALPDQADGSPSVAPAVAGDVAVVAQDGLVHGLRLTDGHPLWSWTGGQSVYGLWRWQGLVVVLTDQVSDDATLTGLDAATGQVRWTWRPRTGLTGDLAATRGGELAMVTADNTAVVLSMASGRVLWTHATGASAVLAAAGPVVAVVADAAAAGYAAGTGRSLWTVTGLPSQAQAQAADGLVLVSSTVIGPGQPTALTAIDGSSGRVAWRFDTGTAVTVAGSGPAGLLVSEAGAGGQLYLVSASTGRARWRADTVTGADGAVPLVTAADVVAVEGRVGYQVVDRAAATGRVRWSASVTTVVPPVTAAGALVLVQEEPAQAGQAAPLRAYRLAGGGLAWQAYLPAFVQVPLVVVPGGVLVQPADTPWACPS
jgi:outer membrane protein assembly factor BamB